MNSSSDISVLLSRFAFVYSCALIDYLCPVHLFMLSFQMLLMCSGVLP